MPNAAIRQCRAGLPVRISPAGTTKATLAPGDNLMLPNALLSVDSQKSANGITLKLWGAGGGVGTTSSGPGTPGCGASLSGTVKAAFLTFKVGDVAVPGAQGLYGAGRGGLSSSPTYDGGGGGGTGVYFSHGGLFAVAGGGGGACQQDATFYGYGGDAGALVSGAGKGATGTYSATTYGLDGTLTAGGAGGEDYGAGTPQYLGGPGGGGGGDGSGGGGGAYSAYPYGGTATAGVGGVGGGDGSDSTNTIDSTRGGKGGKGRNNANPGDGGYGDGAGGGGGYGGGGGGGASWTGGGGASSLAPSGWSLQRALDDVDPDRGTSGNPDTNGKAVLVY